MKNQLEAVQVVYSLVKGKNTGLSLYKYQKPTAKTDIAYIVINALPITSGVMQFCTVNVNIHAKDIAEGIPDVQTLSTHTETLVDYFKKYDGTGVMVDFDSNEVFTNEQIGYHFSNIRLKVKIINS